MDLLAHLNATQREAVTHGDGPLLVLAGAGSGKTRVLTYRIAYLIAERGVSPHQIFACTFTNKAANEMKERIVQLVGPHSQAMWIGTFHALCARLLRQHIDRLGRAANFVIFDEGDQLAVIRECLKDLDLDEKRNPPRQFSYAISDAKNELLGPADYARRVQGYKEQLTHRVYELYEEKLAAHNALDFDDLILYAVQLFRTCPDLLERYQERFRYVLVDEFQDINSSQAEFIRRLAGKYRNLCVVGDDDQSIYGWRGADVRIILDFAQDYPDAKIIKLEQNYRSTQRILDSANAVIAHNRGRRPKALWTQNPPGAEIVVHKAASEHEEAFFVANTVNQLIRQDGFRYADFAILYRVNAQSRVLEDVLLNHAIPYRLVGGLRFYDRQEIKDLLAYLRVLYNPSDSLSLLRIINVPPRRIGDKTIQTLQRLAQPRHRSLYEACVEAAEATDVLAASTAHSLRDFVGMMEELRKEAETKPVTEIVRAVAERSGYIDALKEEHTLEAASRLENILEFFTVAQEFEQQNEDPSLTAFLSHISLISDLDQLNPQANAVTLMTLHSAKGLEFPVVFLVGLEEGLFPHQRSLNSQSEMEEERRLCYVGMTRARQRLYLTHTWRRTLYGRMEVSTPSRFLRELPPELAQTVGRSPAVTPLASPSPPAELASAGQAVLPKDERATGGLDMRALLAKYRQPPAPQTPRTYRPGQRVRHPKFGEGLVVSCRGQGEEGEVSIAFLDKDLGVKKFALAYVKLEEV